MDNELLIYGLIFIIGIPLTLVITFLRIWNHYERKKEKVMDRYADRVNQAMIDFFREG